MIAAASAANSAGIADTSAVGEPGRGRCRYRWNGQDYYGLNAVAAAAGVTRSTVLYHLRENGNLDSLGVWNASRYEWRGKIYRRQADVAAAAGVVPSAVGKHLKINGNLNTLGIGSGRNNSRAAKSGRVVRLGPQQWQSISALARDLGATRATVKRWLKRGDLEQVQARLMSVGAKARKGISA